MKALKKLSILSAGVLALTLSACGEVCPKYMRDSDYAVYDAVLGDYQKLYEEAAAESNDSKRFVKYAIAEAALLDSATFMPTTTQGGNYAITRIAPRTVPYSFWGNDSDRLRGTVVVAKGGEGKNFITSADRAELLAKWNEAKTDPEKSYDPKALLTAKGYTIADTYSSSYSTFPETLDVLNTSMAADTESLVNAVDGLLEYDNFGVAHGRIAESWEVEIEEDEEGNPYDVWTFYLKEGLKWYNADGTVYGNLTADDFVAGFQHMLDAQAGLEWLAQGVVDGVDEYLKGDITDFAEVGVTALDDYTLEFRLCKVESFFPTRLSYSCFMPMNRAYFLAKGGAFGIEAFKTASTSANYKYGLVSDRTSVVYNGPYTPSRLVDGTIIEYKLNNNYPGAEEISSKTLKWIYDAGENPTAYYQFAQDGDINGCGLGAASGLLDKAKGDGTFAKYAYIADTNAVTYFGGFNTNRGTFETGSVKSEQSEAEKEFTHRAMNNKNFRMALQHGWDRASWNAVSTGEELAAKNLRNTYTQPEFVSLSEEVVYHEGKADAHTFPAGTSYGTMIQYFLKNIYKRDVNVADGQDGWFNATLSKQYFDAFKAEIGDLVQFPIKIEVVYYSGSTSNTAQAKAFEQGLENVLGKDNVDVVLLPATTSQDYYAAGYRAANGEAGNFDVFYGSGWGPDYGDPSTYLETFLGDGAGYMTKVIGLF
jgi:peptide/nickel transport system substrate-binding protein/oligopeptide transport system substrate-binding protein